MSANQIRRFLLSKLPSVAIEWVDISKNGSVLPDSLLAHRLGLVPINSDPRRLIAFDGTESSNNCLIFTLNVVATENSFPVYSDSLIWVPFPGQEEQFGDEKPYALPNCLLFELMAGQEVSLRCIAIKGTPKEHVKWCGVFTSLVESGNGESFPIEGDDRTLYFEPIGNLDPVYIMEEVERVRREGF